MQEKETTQTTLYGGMVAEDENPLVFVKIHEEVVADGDQFSMNLKTAKLKVDDEGNDKCITVVDTDKNQALTVYFNQHENAQYKSTPDGVRLGGAVARSLKVNLTSNEELESVIKENDLTLTVIHNGSKGRLWTVQVNR